MCPINSQLKFKPSPPKTASRRRVATPKLATRAVTLSDSRQYQRAEHLVRRYPGTPEGNAAARRLQARHEARMTQQGPPKTREDWNCLARERYHRNTAVWERHRKQSASFYLSRTAGELPHYASDRPLDWQQYTTDPGHRAKRLILAFGAARVWALSSSQRLVSNADVSPE